MNRIHNFTLQHDPVKNVESNQYPDRQELSCSP